MDKIPAHEKYSEPEELRASDFDSPANYKSLFRLLDGINKAAGIHSPQDDELHDRIAYIKNQCTQESNYRSFVIRTKSEGGDASLVWAVYVVGVLVGTLTYMKSPHYRSMKGLGLGTVSCANL
jgi:hypothetical protein